MKHLEWLFARRYLFSSKSHSVINIISGVSALAVAIPVAAMIILLSVFNGFEELVRGLYNDFDADILIEPATGKTFDDRDDIFLRIQATEGVEAVSGVLEDNALLEYRGRQYIATLRGVDSLYEQVIPIRKMVREGEYKPMLGFVEQALVGQGVAYNLGVRHTLYDRIHAYAPKRGAGFSSLLPLASFNQNSLFPSGTFVLDTETDSKYVITPIGFTWELFDYPGRYTSLMVKVADRANHERVRSLLAKELGSEFTAKTRLQQKASLYKIMTYEKWGVFLIILMVLIIASFSVMGSLTMLIIDKRKDIRTLTTFGATAGFIRGVFIREGMLISLSGSVAGLLLGLGFCLGQQHWGWIEIPAETFLVESYPVVIEAGDLAGVIATILAVGWLIARLTVVKMIPKSDLRI